MRPVRHCEVCAFTADSKERSPPVFLRAVREPGAWEAHNLGAAIGFLAARLYGASIASLKRTLTVTKQGLTSAPKIDEYRIVANLRQALAAADVVALKP